MEFAWKVLLITWGCMFVVVGIWVWNKRNDDDR